MAKKFNSKKFERTQSKHNPGRYGKYWQDIEVEMMTGAKAVNPVHPATQPIIGTLCVGSKRMEITFSEANRIIEQLHDAKYRFNIANRLGMLEATDGTYRG